MNFLRTQRDQFALHTSHATHLNGSLDVGLPLDNGPQTNAYEALLTFRLWAEF